MILGTQTKQNNSNTTYDLNYGYLQNQQKGNNSNWQRINERLNGKH